MPTLRIQRLRLDSGIAVALAICTIFGAFIGGYVVGHDEATEEAEAALPMLVQEQMDYHYQALYNMIGPDLHVFVTRSGGVSFSSHCPSPEHRARRRSDAYKDEGKPLIGRDDQ
jgi:hypothetical protein